MQISRSEYVALWRDHVCRPALSSSRLVFALSVAYAAPLATLLGHRPAAFHFFGEDASGLPAIAWIANRLYSVTNRMPTWADLITDPATVSNDASDGLLLLDGFGDANAAQRFAAAALWSDAKGPAPMTLSIGDVPLIAADSNAAERSPWLASIPADAGTGRGVFDAEQSCRPAVQASWLARTAQLSRGGAGAAWVAHLNGIFSRAGVEVIRAAVTDPFDKARQQNHVDLEGFEPFQLVAAAGEYATSIGMTGWPSGSATAAAYLTLVASRTSR